MLHQPASLVTNLHDIAPLPDIVSNAQYEIISLLKMPQCPHEWREPLQELLRSLPFPYVEQTLTPRRNSFYSQWLKTDELPIIIYKNANNKLNNILGMLKNITLAKTLIQALNALNAYYQDIISQLKNKNLQSLSTFYIRLFRKNKGWYKFLPAIDEKIVSCILNANLNLNPSHPCIITLADHNIELLLNPTNLQQTFALEYFQQFLWGDRLPVTQQTTQISLLGYNQSLYLGLVSAPITGLSLNTYLSSQPLSGNAQQEPASILNGPRPLWWFSDHFSQLFLQNLLFDPVHDGFENYIFYANNKDINYSQLVCLNRSALFASEVIRRDDGQHTVGIRTFIYFLDQMNKPLDYGVAERITTISIELLLMQWLHRLKQQELELEEIFDEAAHYVDKTKLNIASLQLPKGIVIKLYNKLKKLQQLVKNNSRITHQEILMQIEPAIAHYYRALNKLFSGNYFKSMEVLADNENKRPSFESLGVDEKVYALSPPSPRTVFIEADPFKTTDTIDQSQAAFLQAVDFSIFDVGEQQSLLEYIAQYFPNIQELTLKGCDIFNSYHNDFVSPLKSLRKLTFINCMKITLLDLVNIMRHTQNPKLHICINQCPQLESLSVLTQIIDSPTFQQFSLTLPKGTILQLKPPSKYAYNYLYEAHIEGACPAIINFLVSQGYADKAFAALVSLSYQHPTNHELYVTTTLTCLVKALIKKSNEKYGDDIKKLYQLIPQHYREKLTEIIMLEKYANKLEGNKEVNCSDEEFVPVMQDFSNLELRSQLTKITDGEDIIETTKKAIQDVLQALPETTAERPRLLELINRLDQPETLLSFPSNEKDKRMIETKIRMGNDAFSSNDPLFDNIHHLRAQLQYLRVHAATLMKKVQLEDCFKQCIDFYYNYIVNFCKHDEIGNERLKPRPRLFSPDLGVLYISAKRVNHILTQKIRNNTGRSCVTQLNEEKNNIDIHFKFYPQSPGIEAAVDSINKAAFCDQIGSSPTALLLLVFENIYYLILASKTVPGKNVLQYIKEYEFSTIRFKSENFTAAFFLKCALLHPSDDKLDNSIVKEEDGQILLVGVDNDRGFVPSIIQRVDGQHIPLIRSFLFFSPQMDEVIDSEMRNHFLTLSPELFLLNQLFHIQQRDRRYQQFIEQFKHLEQYFAPSKQIPLRLLKGTIVEMYGDFKHLQKLIKKNPELSHRTLFRQLNPAVAAFYEEIDQRYTHIEQKMRALYNNTQVGEGDTFESLELESYLTETRIVAEADYDIWEYGKPGYELISETAVEAAFSLLEALDWQELDEKTQLTVLQKISIYFKEGKSVTLKNCDILTDERLQSFALFEQLEKLKLIKCNNVTINSILYLLNHFPQLHLFISHCAQLDVKIWRKLLDNPNCEQLSLGIDDSRFIQIKPLQAHAHQYYYEVWAAYQAKKETGDSDYLAVLLRFLDSQHYGLKAFHATFILRDRSGSQFRSASSQSITVAPNSAININNIIEQKRNEVDAALCGFARSLVYDEDLQYKLNVYLNQLPTNMHERLLKYLSSELESALASANKKSIFIYNFAINELKNFKLPDGSSLQAAETNESWSKMLDQLQIGNRVPKSISINKVTQRVSVPLLMVFDQLFSGMIVPRSELSKLRQGDSYYLAFVSETITGASLENALIQNPNLEGLDHEHYSYQVIFSLLFCHLDSAPDNFFVTQTINGLRLMRYDNEINTKITPLKCYNILFCMKQMHKPIDVGVVDTLLKLKKFNIIDSWLSKLKKLHEKYSGLFPGEVKKITLPHRFIIEIYHKIELLQVVLERKPSITLFGLFEMLEPYISRAYLSIPTELSILQKWDQLYHQLTIKIKVNAVIDLKQAKQQLKRLCDTSSQLDHFLKTLLKKDHSEYKNLPEKFKEKLFNKLPFVALDIETQIYLLKISSHISFTNLGLQYCAANGLQFKELISNSHHSLQSVKLRHCSMMDHAALSPIADCSIIRELHLEEMEISRLSFDKPLPASLTHITLEHCTRVTIINFTASQLVQLKLIGFTVLPIIAIHSERPYKIQFIDCDFSSVDEEIYTSALYEQIPTLPWALSLLDFSLAQLQKMGEQFFNAIKCMLNGKPILDVKLPLQTEKIYVQPTINAAMMGVLVRLLPHHLSIFEINLSGYLIEPDSIKLLSEYLAKNTTVQKLRLINTGLNAKSLSYLSSMLKENKTLRNLYLSKNPNITIEKLPILLAGLEANQTLTMLDYDFAEEMCDATAVKITAKIQKNNAAKPAAVRPSPRTNMWRPKPAPQPASWVKVKPNIPPKKLMGNQ